MKRAEITPGLYRGRWGKPRMVERVILMPPRGIVEGVTYYRPHDFERGQITLTEFAKWAVERIGEPGPSDAVRLAKDPLSPLFMPVGTP